MGENELAEGDREELDDFLQSQQEKRRQLLDDQVETKPTKIAGSLSASVVAATRVASSRQAVGACLSIKRKMPTQNDDDDPVKRPRDAAPGGNLLGTNAYDSEDENS